MRHAAWILTVAFGLSLIYELYRATSKAGTSRHDSMRTFVVQGIPLYTLAGVVIALLFTGREWAASVGSTFSVAMICVSIFYYNPRIMLARQPGIIDWFEDLVFTGLLFVAAALLLYAMFGTSIGSFLE
jgi:hypothetical protein